MLAAFGKYETMERGAEDGESLLDAPAAAAAEVAGGGDASSLAATADLALQDARVREMLAAFRAEGPGALARFVDDPACSASLESLRSRAGALPPPPPPAMPASRDPRLPLVEAVSEAAPPAVAPAALEAAAPVVADGLQRPVVREMLEAFRAEGPAALQRFAADPECAAVVARLRGVRVGPTPAPAPAPPRRVAPVAGRRPRVLLGCAGSVATVKAPRLAAALATFADVRLVLTARARTFFDRAEAYDAEGWRAFGAAAVPVLGAEDDWAGWRELGDPVPHIDLRNWADVFLVAPLSANMLAKLAHGLCDDLLSCVARAWDFAKPLVVAPAMNTHMWDHPLTTAQLATLAGFGCVAVPPAAKRLACGDVGVGALADVQDIVRVIRGLLLPDSA